MGRSETERREAIENAIEVFWNVGYDDASVETLVKATGFNRYALYNAFGGKRDLFIAALEVYRIRAREIFKQHLNAPGQPPLEGISKVLDWSISEMAHRHSGCLICTVAAEVAHEDEAIADCVQTYFNEIEKTYAEALNRAAMRDELGAHIAPEPTAAMLLTLMLGLAARGKAGADEATLINIKNAALSMLKPVEQAPPIRH